ncbi:hypothetical protein C8R44DRAFT_816612, partial [Mycena epipterygia]
MLSQDQCVNPTAYSSPQKTPPSPSAVPPRRLFETQRGHPAVRLTLTRDWDLSAVYPAPPASRSSIAHIGADVRVIAANGSILHIVTPKATKVKAGGDRFGCVRVMAQHRVLAHRVHDDVEGPRCAGGEPRQDRVPAQLARAELGRRDSAAWAPVRTLGCRRRRVLASRYLGASNPTLSSKLTLTISSVACISSATNRRRRHVAQNYRRRAAHLGHRDARGLRIRRHLRQRLPYRSHLLLRHLLRLHLVLNQRRRHGAQHHRRRAAHLSHRDARGLRRHLRHTSSFSHVAGTSLSITGAAQLTWATATREAYGVTNVNDYPTGSRVFSAIDLKLSSGAVPK